jgi:exosortase/archaeosortase family protein
MTKRLAKKRLGRASTGLQAWWLDKVPVLQFGIKFTTLFLVLYVLLAFRQVEYVLYLDLRANAWVANLLLNLFRQGTHLTDVTIRSASFAIAVRRGCDAIEPSWLLGAAIVAFPSPWNAKLVGLGFGILTLQFLNIIRITSLYWIGCAFPSFFYTAHMELWPALFVVMAILLFVTWKGTLDEH